MAGYLSGVLPGVGGAEPKFKTFDSSARGKPVTYGWATPPDHEPDGLPVVLVLHGRGDDAHSAFDSLAAHEFLAQHVANGGAPVGIASVDGGETYWHPRADGDDPLAMISGELLPRLGEIGFDTGRLSLLGYSMGGFGALMLAREASNGRFGAPGQLVAAAASSPALFARASVTSAGSFDDAEDFERWGDLAADPDVGDLPLSVSCGADDPFRAETERYCKACDPAPAGSLGEGGHDHGYWRSLLPDQLVFLSERS
ncbi:esterase family protein [Kineosporia rhizophila]|uniref:alpha/beta hydrolase n=1 Tax=Kineosporia sp. NBRC 101677 TaxID=3032197 RepID=UPI000AE7B54E|nr:alpha/beta hydrolase-fold protein [Kineosporia sp. NBRC 101677]MCE0534618.1 esterase family protein [Kineosporia rhizophila]